MPEYKNGKIYQIVCNITGEVYIGSTCCSLEERLRLHRSKRTNERPREVSKQIIDRGDYYIELLETYPCENRHELELKETEYQKNINCINKQLARRSKQEYYKDNKEIIVESRKVYYENNKELISQRKKAYHENNKELVLQKHKEYRDANKELILQKYKTKVECECGSVVTKTALSPHRRTKKHLNYISTLPCVYPLPLGTEVEDQSDSSCLQTVNVSVQNQD